MKPQSLIIGALAIASLAIPATASAQGAYGYTYNPPVQNVQCERQRKDDQFAGVLVGAIAGGLIGGAIGNNIDDGDAYRYRGHRGHRGYRGYRGHHGHGGYYKGNGNSDEVAAGAILGAIVGGLAGGAIAEDTRRPCQVATPYGSASGGAYPTGGIPRTTDGLYGGPEVMTYPNTPPPSRTYPVSTTAGPTLPPQPGTDIECRTIERETRLPDGQVIRDPIMACRDPYDGRWEITDGFGDENY
jgi:surface antigen